MTSLISERHFSGTMQHYEFQDMSKLSSRGIFVARDKQAARLSERRSSPTICASVCGRTFEVFPGVYDTGLDTELMIRSVSISSEESFLEVGCGTGAVSVFLATRACSGVGVDINEVAVSNAQHNAAKAGLKNLFFLTSDVFANVSGKYDVIVCNPPYNAYRPRDVIDRMFWDPADEMKQSFFRGVGSRLRRNGRVYFGWADFGDLDPHLPFRLSGQCGLEVTRVFAMDSPSRKYAFFVLELRKSRQDCQGVFGKSQCHRVCR